MRAEPAVPPGLVWLRAAQQPITLNGHDMPLDGIKIGSKPLVGPYRPTIVRWRATCIHMCYYHLLPFHLLWCLFCLSPFCQMSRGPDTRWYVIGQGSQGQLSGPFHPWSWWPSGPASFRCFGHQLSGSSGPPQSAWSATGTRFGRWMLDGCNTSVSGCKARCSAAFHIRSMGQTQAEKWIWRIWII